MIAIDVTVDTNLLDAAVKYAAPILAARSRRHPEWVNRRMREEVNDILAGRRPMGELGMVAFGLAMQAGERLGTTVLQEVEMGVVVNLRPNPSPP